MAMGMSYDDFWHGDVRMVKAYRQAYRLKKQIRNTEQYMMGMYVYHAICDASPLFAFKPQDPVRYLEEPFPIDDREAKEREERKEREHYLEMIERMNSFAESFNKKRGNDNG